MKIRCLGVGEAFDERYPNSCYLVASGDTNLMLDCGRSAPDQFWKLDKPPDFLNGVWISHLHDDHVIGLPAVLKRMCNEGRTKPMTIICGKNDQQIILEKLRAYCLRFPTVFTPVKPGDIAKLGNLKFSFAPTVHSMPNLAVRIEDGTHAICYSGDGELISATQALYEGADLLIQEGFLLDGQKPGHTSIADAILAAEKSRVLRVVLTHMDRSFRKNDLPRLRAKICDNNKLIVSIPELMDEYDTGECE